MKAPKAKTYWDKNKHLEIGRDEYCQGMDFLKAQRVSRTVLWMKSKREEAKAT